MALGLHHGDESGDKTLKITEDLNYAGVLQAHQAELERALTGREVIAVNTSADLFDQIQNTAERDMAVGSLERKSTQLGSVRAALRRIDQSTFGICLNCEEEISQRRLAAVPWASFCLNCQEAEDRHESPAVDDSGAKTVSILRDRQLKVAAAA